MSIRRKRGDWVWLGPNTGFVGESDRLKVQIPPDPYADPHDFTDWAPCLMDCGDDDCQEWPTLWTEPDPKADGKRHVLCHVSECQYFDAPQTERGST
jgi:hypothetical protein